MASPVIYARDLINGHLRNIYNAPSGPLYSTLGGAALGLNAGAAGSIIDGMQGDRQSLADNAMLDTVVNGVGYGGLAAGVGALTTPGLYRQGVLDMQPKHEQLRAKSRRSLGNAVGKRALIGAGITAAGVGLLNLINAFGQRNPEVYY